MVSIGALKAGISVAFDNKVRGVASAPDVVRPCPVTSGVGTESRDVRWESHAEVKVKDEVEEGFHCGFTRREVGVLWALPPGVVTVKVAGEDDVGVVGDDVVRELGGEKSAYCVD